MGSLITSTLRTQARVVFLASRARLAVGAPVAARSFGLVASRRTQNAPSFARALSSSQALGAEYVGRERKERPASPPNKTIFLGNLPHSMEDVEIEQYLTPFGPIVSIRMSTRPDGSFMGFAHIEFANIADATKVFEAHTAEPLFIAGRTVRINYAAPLTVRSPTPPNTSIFVGNLPLKAREEEVKEFMSTFGPIASIRMGSADRLSIGFAHVDFVNLADATKVLEAHTSKPLFIAGRVVGINYAGRVTTPYHKLYIPDFSHGDASLRECFDSFNSDIVSVHTLRDKAGKSKGSGFVEFKSISKATEALHELDGKTINGHLLKISFARPPKPREPRGHAAGGGGHR